MKKLMGEQLNQREIDEILEMWTLMGMAWLTLKVCVRKSQKCREKKRERIIRNSRHICTVTGLSVASYINDSFQHISEIHTLLLTLHPQNLFE